MIKIIKPGKLPEPELPKIHKLKCSTCGCEVECLAADGKFMPNMDDIYIDCPTCTDIILIPPIFK